MKVREKKLMTEAEDSGVIYTRTHSARNRVGISGERTGFSEVTSGSSVISID